MNQQRLFRPFSAVHFLAALPASCGAIAVLEQTKEPGAAGELALPRRRHNAGTGRRARRTPQLPQGHRRALRAVVQGLQSANGQGGFDELGKPGPKNSFTVGITDDVSHTSLAVDPTFSIEPNDVVRAVFYGLGADGTVGANKNTVKIIVEDAGLFAQGYFVYDFPHKSGAQTISHLRFGPRPIRAPYLIASAGFFPCHQFNFIERLDVLRLAASGCHLPAQQPVRPRHRLGSSAALRPAADYRQEAASLRDRRIQGRPRRLAQEPDQHRSANLFFRHLWGAMPARSRDPTHQGGDPQNL